MTTEQHQLLLRLTPVGDAVLRRYTRRRGDVTRIVADAVMYAIKSDGIANPLASREEANLKTSVRLPLDVFLTLRTVAQRLDVSMSAFVESALIEADRNKVLVKS